ncbi:MAG: NAD-dependent dehydratase [Deltaproteobacteria bacterium RIFCSPLOWO2_02_FULL_46_8]|nr:MAG: NAD-dependent dehydratase [Deltaproteobacteria bacterium RIFCSPLOWO2_02_FULL_46_8]
MRILIVGGAGYLGGALTNILMPSQHEILVYDFLLYEESYRKQVPFVRGDVRDHEKLKRYLNWADVVVWLAALVGDPACALNETLTIDINERSIEFLRDTFDGRVIFTSSCSVYGASNEMLTESSSIQPLSLYARTKTNAEKILEDSNAVIFRLGTLYGISDDFSRIRFDLVVNTLAMRAALHRKIIVYGGAQYRPLLHVRDAAQAIASQLERPSTTGLYNLHSENRTILDISECIKQFFPDVEIETSGVAFQDNRNYRVSSDRAQRELGFSPKHAIGDGIQQLKALLEEGRIKDSFTTRFSNYLYLKPLLSEYESPLGRVIKHNL